MGIEITPLGLKKPDGNESIREGDNVIAFNAQKTQDLTAETREQLATESLSRAAQDAALAGRIGVAEALINAGAGGPGLSADPDHAGLYFFAGPTISPDPVTPGLYTF